MKKKKKKEGEETKNILRPAAIDFLARTNGEIDDKDGGAAVYKRKTMGFHLSVYWN